MKYLLMVPMLAALLLWGCEAPQPPAATSESGPSGGTPEAGASQAAGEQPVDQGEYMKHYTVQAGFDEIWEFVQIAIGDRGIKINNISHIGRMLTRTGEDLGETQQLFVKAKVVEFCSATVSRRMMAADPHNIVFCPYIIAVYELPDEPDTVHIAFRRPLPVGSEETRASLREVEQLLESIIAEAIQ